MARTRLTELGVAKLTPPASGRIELFDSALPCFGVRVTSSGVKSFFVMTRVRGTLKRVTHVAELVSSDRHPTYCLARRGDGLGEEPPVDVPPARTTRSRFMSDLDQRPLVEGSNFRLLTRLAVRSGPIEQRT